jgi:hypothetical protein
VSHERLWPKHPKDQSAPLRPSDVHPEDVLVDLVEGELDQEFEKDLEIWLNSSEGAESNIRDEVEMLSQLRQSLKDSDIAAVPESGNYYEALEERIMSSLDQAIETGLIQDRSRVQALSETETKGVLPDLLERADAAHRLRSAPRGMAARAGHFAVLAGLALLMTGKWPFQIDGVMTTADRNSKTGTQDLSVTREAAPLVLSNTILSFEAGADLSIELVARENIQRLLAGNSKENQSYSIGLKN